MSEGAWHSLGLRESRRGLLVSLDGVEVELAAAAIPLPLQAHALRLGEIPSITDPDERLTELDG